MVTKDLPLGKTVTHSTTYDAGQLCPVARGPARQKLGLHEELPFYGEDRWTAYELSWLNKKGKPVVAVGKIIFPCTTPNIIESKSLKLYCNSFNQTPFESEKIVQETMAKDLSRIAGEQVEVHLIPPERFELLRIAQPEGECIDGLDVDIVHYHIHPSLLETDEEVVEQSLHSHLLRTNCPVTGQPDWATIVINYHGQQIVKESLLVYLISYRHHTGFHENCVERIFIDIMSRCKPDRLLVYARFTRRGGIDINPYRSTENGFANIGRLARQ
ncbi:NADPH-dependent 7-cyano-7-deazaguanine reductase QueF [Desulfogranum marinum]|uniref:NADPH-dependent 7-cyano-7-deazaguanine reductase QueF n=1 Tax=Desulfogranum marinum TaxID=453220 RepID=UPI001963E3F3|nr:NADPH-dependent 7-cyano-7-deazaguanine reductase QueF [Desulfogranum marinum]MBM9514589.1 NADPH-dependent 7-cyano-7-deazaguanine reductase QueF [Desulfogranum marinum]